MKVNHGISCTMTAKPGRGDRLTELLLTGLEDGNPGSSEHCIVYLVSRSQSNPDVVHITEGWTTEQDHDRVFETPAAQAIVARFEDLLAGAPAYADHVPVDGKAAF
jgi:quinol monooxygenase YgiN